MPGVNWDTALTSVVGGLLLALVTAVSGGSTYLHGWQNSGDALNAYGYIRAVKLR